MYIQQSIAKYNVTLIVLNRAFVDQQVKILDSDWLSAESVSVSIFLFYFSCRYSMKNIQNDNINITKFTKLPYKLHYITLQGLDNLFNLKLK